MEYKVFILDVDGVMTTGHFLYSEAGKQMKIFGPDDNDGLGLLNPYIEIRFVTGDRKGFPISNKRIKDDMKFKLDLVSTIKRIEWINERYNPKEVIYMGDGIFDHYVMKEAGYSIAPENAVMVGDADSDYQAAQFNNIQFVLRRTELNETLQQKLECQMVCNFQKI